MNGKVQISASPVCQQINKGSIDAITGKARYTLNEEWLLRENVEARPQVRYLTHFRFIFHILSFCLLAIKGQMLIKMSARKSCRKSELA